MQAFYGWMFRVAVAGLCATGASALAAQEAKPVTVVAVGTETEAKRFTGTITAEQTVSLSFGVGGLVKTLTVDADTAVASGQLLAMLDGAQVAQTVAAARAALTKANNDLAAAQSNLSRMQILVDQGLDKQSTVDEAQAKVTASASAVDDAKAALAAAEADVAKVDLAAPADGVVVSKSAQPFQEVAAGQEIFTFQAFGDLRAVFSVTEAAAKDLQVGMQIDIEIVDPAGGSIGTLASLEAGSGGWQGKASLANPPNSVRSGQSVIVTIDAAKHGEGFVIPVSAVMTDNGATSVFAISDNGSTVQRLPVVVSATSDNEATVTEGLVAGDKVVIDPIGLSDGDAVTITSK